MCHMICWNTVNIELGVKSQYILESNCFYFHKKTVELCFYMHSCNEKKKKKESEKKKKKESTNSKGLTPLPKQGIFILTNRFQP